MASTNETIDNSVGASSSCDWKEYFEMTTAVISLPSSLSEESLLTDDNAAFDQSSSSVVSSAIAQEQAARQSSVGTTTNHESYYISHYAVAGVAIIGVMIMLIMLISSRRRNKKAATAATVSSPSTADGGGFGGEGGGAEGFETTFDHDDYDAQSNIDFDAPTVQITRTLDTYEDVEGYDERTTNTRSGRFGSLRNSFGRKQKQQVTPNGNQLEQHHYNKASDQSNAQSSGSSINMFLLVSTSWYLFWFGISHFLRGMIVDIDAEDNTWITRLYHVSLMFYLPGLVLLASELEIFQLSSAIRNKKKKSSKESSNGNKKVFHFLVYTSFVIAGIIIDLLLPVLKKGDNNANDMFLTGFIVDITYVIVAVTALMVVTYDIFTNCCGCNSDQDHESRMNLLSAAKDNMLFALCLILFFIGSMMVKIVLLPVCTGDDMLEKTAQAT